MVTGKYITIPIHGRPPERWRITYKKLRNLYGLVEWKKRTIWIDPRQTAKEKADTIAHEITHVALHDVLSEEATETLGRAIGEGLAAMESLQED